MSDDKKWYYLKLKENFFDREEIRILEAMPNGMIYSNLYLKMCLKSLNNNGKLIFRDGIPYDHGMISTITGVEIDSVRVGLEILKKMDLIEIFESGEIFMLDIDTLTGHGSTEAERKRLYREKVKSLLPDGTMSRSCPKIVHQSIEYRDKSIEYRDKSTDKEDAKVRPVRQKFEKPSLDEVLESLNTDGLSRIDADSICDTAKSFYDYYDSNGWLVGRNKMKDWRAALRNWFRRSKAYTQKKITNYKPYGKGLDPKNEEQQEALKRLRGVITAYENPTKSKEIG